MSFGVIHKRRISGKVLSQKWYLSNAIKARKRLRRDKCRTRKG
nr:MAG TPA: hypothetical protein [Caudoviricetes sp.]